MVPTYVHVRTDLSFNCAAELLYTIVRLKNEGRFIDTCTYEAIPKFMVQVAVRHVGPSVTS